MVKPGPSLISYSDSLGKPIPAMLLKVLQWWLLDLCRMIGFPVNSATVTVAPLLITSQGNSFSCGILSTNSIAHYLIGDGFLLVKQDPASVKTYWIERTTEILMLDGEFVHD